MTLDPSEVIADYEGWLHRVAGNIRPMGDSDHDDLVQEGRIAMWRALDRYDDVRVETLPGLLTKAAKAAMLDRVTGRRGWTGSEQAGRALGEDVLDQHHDDIDPALPGHDVRATVDVAHEVATRDEADRLLGSLPHREAAVLLLMEGYGHTSQEVAPVLDLSAVRVRQIRVAALSLVNPAA
jgi:RNA polymerase sigma factor (sigma-70 family)